ncbi:diphosphomevalonate decarboxylase [Listeria kieliensis]|uniref:diphosphomevalonate decarboxylase n=1 Tax=Listeria kieliensis TaxID=1621700 RepID=A0A3D8TR82_9LIST|nr:diphosphomevalonate decarboxylase [Listeria kieliensis]RDX01310.1 diphosphomevalonate decarboxylase [Listeria kieliensis]
MKVTAVAHTNIALIKYWGKRDEKLILPSNSSLSITLDKFFTETTFEWSNSQEKDLLVLNGEEREDKKIQRYLDVLRHEFDITLRAVIHSENHVPTAAGLASSASAFAALATAASASLGRKDSKIALSRLARLGSGSASRSIFGGLAIWQKGEKADGSDSYAVPFESELTDQLAVVVAIVSDRPKKISSRSGMKQTVLTSPFFAEWTRTAELDLEAIKKAFANSDFTQVGEILEHNAMKMHATTLSANPPFTYFSQESLLVMEAVRELRADGIEAYFTMDAGPNVKIVCLRQDEEKVASRIDQLVGRVLICHAGEGAKVIQNENGN